jgi:small subunit ribosomal protein S18
MSKQGKPGNKQGKQRGTAGKTRENPNKKIKKKTSILTADRVDYVDYKDVNLLQRFISDRSKIRARRVTGNDVQQQRDVAIAIKNARELALLPYTKRVVTTRGSRSRSSEPEQTVEEVVETVEEVDAE